MENWKYWNLEKNVTPIFVVEFKLKNLEIKLNVKNLK